MAELQFGAALIVADDMVTREKIGWSEHLAVAQMAEEIGFDTVWVTDELFWRMEEGSDEGVGWWDGVSMAGAIAASTSTVAVGTWVLSALHRTPALTVRAIETIDEISGGRAIFGFGAGHAGDQGRTFGFPLDKTIGRYEEALQVVIPAIRAGRASFSGEYHSAEHLINKPRGPQGSAIPILLGGHGPRTIGLAARYADIWSGYDTGDSSPGAYAERLALLDQACEAIGRDPASIGRSVSASVTSVGDPPSDGLEGQLRGSPQQIAESLLSFGEVGVTSVEVWLSPYSRAAMEAMAPIMEIVKAG